jgi:hypothetical protein
MGLLRASGDSALRRESARLGSAQAHLESRVHSQRSDVFMNRQNERNNLYTYTFWDISAHYACQWDWRTGRKGVAGNKKL